MAGENQYSFVADRSAIKRSAILATFFLLPFLVWWSLSMDLVLVLTTVPVSLLAGAFSVRSHWRHAKRAADALGQLQLGDDGIRWLLGNQTVSFELTWDAIESAMFHRKDQQVVFKGKDQAHHLLAAITQNGAPVHAVRVPNFDEFILDVSRHIPINEHRPTVDQKSVTRVLRLWLLCLGVAASLCFANLLLMSFLSWSRLWWALPSVVFGMGCLLAVAWFKLRSGRGPMVSPLYGAGYSPVIYRFLVVCVVANFVIVGLLNGVRP